MLLEGAAGDTAIEIRNALRLSPDKDEFREQLNAYLSVLKANDSDVTLLNSNAIFVAPKVSVKKEFIIMLYNVYLTEVRVVNFREPVPTADLINTWIRNNTKGHINTLLEPEHIDPMSELLLANSLYFKSNWQHSFNPQLTRGACFRSRGNCQTVAMMELQAGLNYAYVDDLRAHALELPYEVQHIDPMSELLLANSLYFKSNWQHSFNPQLTRGACFRSRGNCQTVAMMELQAGLNYAYVDDLRAHALELPYENGRYSMFLLVPYEQDGVTQLLRDLPYFSLPQIASLMEETDVRLQMPKFTINYSNDMAGALRAMKIKLLFTNKADLSAMFNSSSLVNNIFHKVHIAVDETGTVAAAASSAMVIPLIENGVQIRVDHPFLFFIRDNKLGLVLFEGKVEEPTPYVEPKPVTPNVTDTYIVPEKVSCPFLFFIRDNKLGLVLFEGKVEEPTPYVEPKPVTPNVTDAHIVPENVSPSERKYMPKNFIRRLFG
ncbi:Serpin B10 [Papilio machaon]|uniref:Serpin B10 n=1 Tax=Papilio machaon TaxID=76193 RepID=A0A0N1IAM8_PAPMA|nr:Serpin B10 [Papilio machaon]